LFRLYQNDFKSQVFQIKVITNALDYFAVFLFAKIALSN
jgi:hypothetical protein